MRDCYCETIITKTYKGKGLVYTDLYEKEPQGKIPPSYLLTPEREHKAFTAPEKQLQWKANADVIQMGQGSSQAGS